MATKLLVVSWLLLLSPTLAQDCPQPEQFCPETTLELNKLMVNPYSDGINAYGQVLSALRDNLAGGENSFLAEIDQQTMSATTKLVDKVKLAAENADSARVSADADVECRVQSVTIFESKLVCFNELISQIEVQIVAAQRELDLSSQEIQQADANLNGANSAVEEAERNVERQRKCIFGRRKRDIWSKIGRGLERVVKAPIKLAERAVCEVRNAAMGAIDNAKRAREKAHNHANACRQRLSNAQNHRNSLQQRQNDVVSRRQAVSQGRIAAQSRLEVIRNRQAQVIQLSEKLRQTATHISQVVGTSRLLSRQVDLGLLLDTQNVIGPLKEIANLIEVTTGNSALNWLNRLSAEDIATIRQRITEAIQASNRIEITTENVEMPADDTEETVEIIDNNAVPELLSEDVISAQRQNLVTPLNKSYDIVDNSSSIMNVMIQRRIQ